MVETGAPVIGEPLDPPGGILNLFQVCLGLRLNKECINQKKKKASNPSNISIKQTQKGHSDKAFYLLKTFLFSPSSIVSKSQFSGK